ncbi:ribosomal protein [Lithospermum erythrorhizon]|uniref:Ribosomal protein n=1 Tax=Lithospermum erythrorhizon TaxID=34254 RepID=A0AAV3P2P3_LITER
MMRLSEFGKLKPLRTSLESLSCRLMQRCSVSRTAKGKGKMKDGQLLKRTKGSFRKGMGTAKGGGGGGGSKMTSEMETMVDQCLGSTAPVRFLKPKERAREAEREKMGITSKAREEEKSKLKKQKKEFNSPFMMGTPGLDLISLGLVDADKIPKYELTVEDGRRLAKEYSRVLMRKHRARQAAETTLLKLKKEAIEALPEHLKAAALVPDLTPFPANRFMATLTPPIEGYIEKVKEAAKRSAGKKKRR